MRKAQKIRKFITKNNLENHIDVPDQYIYWHSKSEQFYVVAKNMNLSGNVAKPSKNFEKELSLSREEGGREGKQTDAFRSNAPQVSLNVDQARGLAKLACLGYTDLSYDNLFFSQDGKVAIVDTAPVKRRMKKALKNSWIFFLFGSLHSLTTQQSIFGIAKLKLYVDNKDALKAVQKVETTHALWGIARLVATVAVLALAIYSVPIMTSNLPLALLAKTINVTFITWAFMKMMSSLLNVASISLIWSYSCQGTTGVKEIAYCEHTGVL